jgi:hypothetical protein
MHKHTHTHTHAHTHTYTHLTTQAPGAGKAWVPKGWRPLVAMDEERSFRGGFVSPFSANMGMVLYRRSARGSGAGYVWVWVWG